VTAQDLNSTTLGWIGTGRMGYPMAERLAKAGCDLAVWNRTAAKAQPLAEDGATIVEALSELGRRDVVFSMVATQDHLLEVLFGEGGVMSGDAAPKIVVDCSTISAEVSGEVRERLADRGTQ
jgi:3-hydroxyisobutyrate dehydrogenase